MVEPCAIREVNWHPCQFSHNFFFLYFQKKIWWFSLLTLEKYICYQFDPFKIRFGLHHCGWPTQISRFPGLITICSCVCFYFGITRTSFQCFGHIFRSNRSIALKLFGDKNYQYKEKTILSNNNFKSLSQK